MLDDLQKTYDRGAIQEMKDKKNKKLDTTYEIREEKST